MIRRRREPHYASLVHDRWFCTWQANGLLEKGQAKSGDCMAGRMGCAVKRVVVCQSCTPSTVAADRALLPHARARVDPQLSGSPIAASRTGIRVIEHAGGR